MSSESRGRRSHSHRRNSDSSVKSRIDKAPQKDHLEYTQRLSLLVRRRGIRHPSRGSSSIHEEEEEQTPPSSWASDLEVARHEHENEDFSSDQDDIDFEDFKDQDGNDDASDDDDDGTEKRDEEDEDDDDWYHRRERRRNRHVEAPNSFDREYTVNQVIERVGMTKYHYKMCIVVIVMTLLGYVILGFLYNDLFTFLPKVLSQDADRIFAALFGVPQIVHIFSSVYWGWLADKYGRKNAIKMMLIILMSAMLLTPFCLVGIVTASGVICLVVFLWPLYTMLNVLVMEFLPHKHTFGFFMIVQVGCPDFMRGLLFIRGSPPALNLAILAILGFSFSMYQLYLLLRMIEQSPKHVVLQPNGRRRAKRIAMSMIQSTKYQVGPKFEIRGSGYKQISLFTRRRVSRIIWQRILIFIGIFMVNLLAWAYIYGIGIFMVNLLAWAYIYGRVTDPYASASLWWSRVLV